jgi:hypothetical protein
MFTKESTGGQLKERHEVGEHWLGDRKSNHPVAAAEEHDSRL